MNAYTIAKMDGSDRYARANVWTHVGARDVSNGRTIASTDVRIFITVTDVSHNVMTAVETENATILDSVLKDVKMKDLERCAIAIAMKRALMLHVTETPEDVNIATTLRQTTFICAKEPVCIIYSSLLKIVHVSSFNKQLSLKRSSGSF